MPTIMVPRSDVSVDEVSEVLHNQLGSRYTVLPDTAMNWNPAGSPRAEHHDTLVVGTGSARLFRAQVRISRGSDQTALRITSGGISALLTLTNRLWMTQKVRRALQAGLGLR
jgi:hypothetical protein